MSTRRHTRDEPTPSQQARAAAALEIWYTNPGGSDYRAPGWTGWQQRELAGMHAALEAPDLDSALAAFGITQGNADLASPEQDRENRALMAAVRQQLAGWPPDEFPELDALLSETMSAVLTKIEAVTDPAGRYADLIERHGNPDAPDGTA